MQAKLRQLSRYQRGATAIEYGVIAGAAALVVLTAVWTIGGSFRSSLSEVVAAIGAATQDEGARGIVFKTSTEKD